MHWVSINDVTYTSTTTNDAALFSLALGVALAVVGLVIVCVREPYTVL